MEYEFKPGVITEAMEFTMENLGALTSWIESSNRSGYHPVLHRAPVGGIDGGERCFIDLPVSGGTLRAEVGDMIYQDQNGVFRPMRKDLFDKIFQPKEVQSA